MKTTTMHPDVRPTKKSSVVNVKHFSDEELDALNKRSSSDRPITRAWTLTQGARRVDVRKIGAGDDYQIIEGGKTSSGPWALCNARLSAMGLGGAIHNVQQERAVRRVGWETPEDYMR